MKDYNDNHKEEAQYRPYESPTTKYIHMLLVLMVIYIIYAIYVFFIR